MLYNWVRLTTFYMIYLVHLCLIQLSVWLGLAYHLIICSLHVPSAETEARVPSAPHLRRPHALECLPQKFLRPPPVPLDKAAWHCHLDRVPPDQTCSV